jgi:hypothetical protein
MFSETDQWSQIPPGTCFRCSAFRHRTEFRLHIPVFLSSASPLVGDAFRFHSFEERTMIQVFDSTRDMHCALTQVPGLRVSADRDEGRRAGLPRDIPHRSAYLMASQLCDRLR